MDSKEGISSEESSNGVDLQDYDLVVLGSGTGSKVAAWTIAEQGKRIVLIERKYIGGSCHNIACMPGSGNRC
jgi:pyruvate/2-oxoglutarate dehydrogenase complex dihydrolipoamide dehydrogenase (E3) component